MIGLIVACNCRNRDKSKLCQRRFGRQCFLSTEPESTHWFNTTSACAGNSVGLGPWCFPHCDRNESWCVCVFLLCWQRKIFHQWMSLSRPGPRKRNTPLSISVFRLKPFQWTAIGSEFIPSGKVFYCCYNFYCVTPAYYWRSMKITYLDLFYQ